MIDRLEAQIPELAKPIILKSVEHAQFILNPEYDGKKDKRWLCIAGCSIQEGNYKIFYTAFNGNTIYIANRHNYKMLLEVGDPRFDLQHRIDVTHVRNGKGIGQDCLSKLLDCVKKLRSWGQDMQCRLVVRYKNRDLNTSNSVAVKTPVAPWDRPLDPEEFVKDNTIKYCGDLTKRIFYGRTLKQYAGKRYFTFKNTLETNRNMRGFACIGLVGNLYGVPPGPAYSKGEKMAATIGGRAFEYEDVKIENAIFVAMTQKLFLEFMKTAGQRGSYMIWTGGHAGIIKNGILYECKPSGKGFTKKIYNEATQSAVCKFEASQLASELLKREKPYFLSMLPN